MTDQQPVPAHTTTQRANPDPDIVPAKSQHVWVTGLGSGPYARMAGLLLAWRRHPERPGWQAWVIYIEPDGSTRQSWLEASSVEPLRPPAT